jgi:hypothetical protein
MQRKDVFFVILLVCGAVAIAGCTGTQNAPSPAPAGTGGQPAASGWSLEVSPTDAVPEYNSVAIVVHEKDYLGYITVSFDGGMGQIHVRKIDVTLFRADGQVKKASIGTKKGDEAVLEGTKQTDRVVVYATMDNGQTYKTNDVQSPYRTRA